MKIGFTLPDDKVTVKGAYTKMRKPKQKQKPSTIPSFTEQCEILEKIRLDLEKEVLEYVSKAPDNYDRKMLKRIYEISEKIRLLYLDLFQEYYARKQLGNVVYRI